MADQRDAAGLPVGAPSPTHAADRWIGIEAAARHLAIPTRTMVWAAGVRAHPLGETLGVDLTKGGRVVVGPDLTVPGHPEVHDIGDLAASPGHDGG